MNRIQQKLVEWLALITIFTTINWVTFSFATWQINPALWSYDVRLGYGMAWVLGNVVVLGSGYYHYLDRK